MPHTLPLVGDRERERELRCIFYTHCTNNTAQVAAMRLLAGFEATSGTDSDGDADVNTDTDPATISALTAYVLALHFSNSRPQRDVCQHKRRRQRRQRRRRPLAMAFERVNSICGDADVTPAARLRRSSTTSTPTSSTTAITSRGTVAADTYKTSQVDGGVVHPWREQTTN